MKKLLCLWLVLFGATQSVLSQGCNDAGLCTIGHIGTANMDDTSKITIGINSSFRLSENETMWFNVQAQSAFQIGKKTSVAIAVPYHFIYGSLGFNQGLGDVSASINQDLLKINNAKISFTFGGKLPVNSSNQKLSDDPLPMVYQTSQGTWDGIVGLNYFSKKWHISAAYQHNFNANENQYIDSLSRVKHLIQYFDSKKINRGDDVLLRIEYHFFKKEVLRYFISILPIYRIQEASIESATGIRIPVDGSSGFTLNMNAGMIRSFGDKTQIKISAAAPAYSRKIRPDGLTGTFVLSFLITRSL